MLNLAPIPQWYAADWTPATSPWELPEMTWEAFERVVDHCDLPASRKDAARTLYRSLWRTGRHAPPLELLQTLLLTTARAFDPGRRKPGTELGAMSAARACGPLPRWSFTDLEMVLTRTWSGTALVLATERHRDLLTRRSDRLGPEETARQLMLLTAGLPVSGRASARGGTEPRLAA